MIDFCYDNLGQFGIGYPNLAQPDLAADEFDTTWPRVVPLRLLLHFKSFGINSRAHTVDQAPVGAWYPVGLAWHDFECDYVALMSDILLHRLRCGEIRVLFYYHEGDNPAKIVDHLRTRFRQHGVPDNCFLFVSANDAAERLTQCVYFCDHQHFFRWVNRRQHPTVPNDQIRPHKFTALNRLHKTWRAHVMADLHSMGILNNSLWSYNHSRLVPDADQQHPLDTHRIPGWQKMTENFLANGPYVCDSSNMAIVNDHMLVNTELYTGSYLHVVLETFMDADASDGCFLTEKTFKCIKYGQPFVIIGTAGSLAQLRKEGYRTFDHVIDPRYDLIQDATDRYLEIRRLLGHLATTNLQKIFQDCLPDIWHNQQVFLNHCGLGLSKLLAHLK